MQIVFTVASGGGGVRQTCEAQLMVHFAQTTEQQQETFYSGCHKGTPYMEAPFDPPASLSLPPAQNPPNPKP